MLDVEVFLEGRVFASEEHETAGASDSSKAGPAANAPEAIAREYGEAVDCDEGVRANALLLELCGVAVSCKQARVLRVQFIARAREVVKALTARVAREGVGKPNDKLAAHQTIRVAKQPTVDQSLIETLVEDVNVDLREAVVQRVGYLCVASRRQEAATAGQPPLLLDHASVLVELPNVGCVGSGTDAEMAEDRLCRP
tara:strand:- start:2939 stop:3532 length:594 start_codon:yes stop_codon:yes gene_type:complete